jgi:hypothetical protein
VLGLGDLWAALAHLLREVPAAFPRFLRLLLARLRDCWRRRTGPDPGTCCLPVPAGVWLQPDAYLYSQRYLMSLGLAVTWDNPDVTLTDMGGALVGSHDLLPATDYRITALIHNRAAAAPAPGLPVVFTLVAFGAGGPARQTIGVVTIDLPVRAAPGEPVPASIVWRTPPAPDHYCIEIDAAWPDDAFPIDNVGQHNTVVRRAAPGQRLQLHVPVYAPRTQRARLQATRLRVRLDGYRLPARPLLRDERESRTALLQRVVEANRAERFAPDAQWNATLSADELVLEGDAVGGVDFSATVPAAAARGSEQRFNVSVNEAQTGAAVGGATVIVQVI